MSIKECPFCGSVDATEVNASLGNDWSVCCNKCGAIGPDEDSAEFAVKAWNEGTPRYHRVHKLEEALKRIRDCDLPGAKGWLQMQNIAKEALE